MRFLIDNALPPRLAELLVAAGYDATHVRSYGMHASRDIDILERAREENRVIISADADFGVILASQAASHPSFILFREPNLLRTQNYMDLLMAALPTLESELASGMCSHFSQQSTPSSQAAFLGLGPRSRLVASFR